MVVIPLSLPLSLPPSLSLLMEALVLYVTHKHRKPASQPAQSAAVQAIKIFRERQRERERESERQEGEGEVKAVVKFSELHSRSCLIPGRQGAASGQRAAGGTIDFAACEQRQIRSDNCDMDGGRAGTAQPVSAPDLHIEAGPEAEPEPGPGQKAETVSRKTDCHFVMPAAGAFFCLANS